MDSLPLLYYLKYFILHVDYKLLQRVFFIYIKRICFWCIKNTGDRLLQATRKIVCFCQGLSIVWVWRKTMVASLRETAGNTCFLGVLSNSSSERSSFTEKRAFCLFPIFEFITFMFYAKNKASMRVISSI